MKNILVLFTLFLTACSSTGVIPMDDGIYMIAKRSAQVGFGPPDGVKADVYIEANQFCDKKNKKVKTVKLDMPISGSLATSSLINLISGLVSFLKYMASYLVGSPRPALLAGIIPAKPGGKRWALSISCADTFLTFINSSLLSKLPTGIICKPFSLPLGMFTNNERM